MSIEFGELAHVDCSRLNSIGIRFCSCVSCFNASEVAEAVHELKLVIVKIRYTYIDIFQVILNFIPVLQISNWCLTSLFDEFCNTFLKMYAIIVQRSRQVLKYFFTELLVFCFGGNKVAPSLVIRKGNAPTFRHPPVSSLR